jgi:predicted hydrocarbon binding protein
MTVSGLDLVGDPVAGRQKLGTMVPIALFRLLRLVGVMEGMKEIAGRGANAIIYRGGKNLGKNVGEKVLQTTGKNLDKYLQEVVNICKDLGIGLLSIPEMDLNRGFIKIRVDECVTCSGMPNVGQVVCHFEGGLIGAIIEKFTEKKVAVTEVECCGKGDTACVFEIVLAQ